MEGPVPAVGHRSRHRPPAGLRPPAPAAREVGHTTRRPRAGVVSLRRPRPATNRPAPSGAARHRRCPSPTYPRRSPRAPPTRQRGRLPSRRPAREVAAYDRSRAAAGVVSRHLPRGRSPRAPPTRHAGPPPVPPARPRSGGIRPVDATRSVVSRHLPPRLRGAPTPTGPLRPAGPPEKWRHTPSTPQVVSATTPLGPPSPPPRPPRGSRDAGPPENWRRTTGRGLRETGDRPRPHHRRSPSIAALGPTPTAGPRRSAPAEPSAPGRVRQACPMTCPLTGEAR